MRRCKWLGLVLFVFMILAQNVYAEVSISVDGEKKGLFNTLDFPPGFEVTQSGTKADITYDNETVTLTSADPGLGTADVNARVTFLTANPAGSLPDQVTLANGEVGQLKTFVLNNANGNVGVRVIPSNILGVTNDVLLALTGESVTFAFDGTYWNLISTTGYKE